MKKKLENRFRGLYWRQLFVTAGMVMLTLVLLGVSFFSLSFNYARQLRESELRTKAEVVARLSAGYLENYQFQNEEEL